MTARGQAKQESSEGQGGVPEGFEVGELGHDPTIKAALALLRKHNRDVSGHEKHARAARRFGWAVFLAGGSAVGMQRDLDRLRHTRGQAAGRLGGLKGKRADAGRIAEAEAALAALDRDIARKESILAAVSEADRRDYRAVADRARVRLETASADLNRYKQARLPAPPEVEERALAAEAAVVEGDVAFAARRARLEEPGPALQAEIGKAIAALATNVRTLKIDLAKEIGRRINADLPRLSRFPERLSGEVVVTYRVMAQAAEIEDRLTGRHGQALAEGLAELTAAERNILDAALIRGVGSMVATAV